MQALLQPAFPLKFAMAAGGLCCAGMLGAVLLLRGSETHTTPEASLSTSLMVHSIRTVRIIPDEPPAKTAIVSSVPFEERWQSGPQAESPEPLPVTTVEPTPQVPKIRTARAEVSDPVCGDKGRRYIYIDRHQYWKCRR